MMKNAFLTTAIALRVLPSGNDMIAAATVPPPTRITAGMLTNVTSFSFIRIELRTRPTHSTAPITVAISMPARVL